jgi:hypothetical protein
MNESMQGGTATQARPTTSNTIPIDDSAFRRLQEMRRGTISSVNPTASDGYLSVMLVQHAGWTHSQTALFLGLAEPGVRSWNEAFEKGTIASGRLEPPAPAAL